MKRAGHVESIIRAVVPEASWPAARKLVRTRHVRVPLLRSTLRREFGGDEPEPEPWTPADATGLVAWWDLTSTDYVSVDGSNNVTGVSDRSGNGHAYNVISATAPTFNATRFGASLGGVDFVAASSTFLARDSAPVTEAPFQVYVVAKTSDDGSAQTVVWLGDKDATNDYWAILFRGSVAGDPASLWLDASGFVATTPGGYTANTTHLLWGLEASSTSRAIRIDGANEGTNATAYTYSVDRFGLGAALDSSPSNFLTGSIAEVVLLNTASTDDRANFHAYFEARYGLTLP